MDKKTRQGFFNGVIATIGGVMLAVNVQRDERQNSFWGRNQLHHPERILQFGLFLAFGLVRRAVYC